MSKESTNPAWRFQDMLQEAALDNREVKRFVCSADVFASVVGFWKKYGHLFEPSVDPSHFDGVMIYLGIPVVRDDVLPSGTIRCELES